MIFSKPLYNLLGFYFEQLHNHPIRTRAISCCVIATSGNIVSQYINGAKAINPFAVIPYAAFGLLFGGTLPHYFYNWLERAVPDEASFAIFKKLIIERLIYSPLFIAFSLYTLSRLEGKTHKAALKDVEHLYWAVLTSSWKYLTLFQFLNLAVVPPMLRVLVVNLIGFFWIVYMSNKRRQAGKSKTK